MTAPYLVATTTPPAITCPDWCERSYQEHLDELSDWDGRAIHKRYVARLADTPLQVSVGRQLLPDGGVDTEAHFPDPVVIVAGHECDLAAVEKLMADLTTAAEIYRSEVTR